MDKQFTAERIAKILQDCLPRVVNRTVDQTRESVIEVKVRRVYTTEIALVAFDENEIFAGTHQPDMDSHQLNHVHVCHICGMGYPGGLLRHLMSEHDNGRVWYAPSRAMECAIALYSQGMDEEDISAVIGADVVVEIIF